MKKKKQVPERVIVKHDEDTHELTIAVTPKSEEVVVRTMKAFAEIEILSAKREIRDYTNDEGKCYKNMVVITTKVTTDKMEPFFDAVKSSLRKGISQSINHIDN